MPFGVLTALAILQLEYHTFFGRLKAFMRGSLVLE
jgi:hypothetical protein